MLVALVTLEHSHYGTLGIFQGKQQCHRNIIVRRYVISHNYHHEISHHIPQHFPHDLPIFSLVLTPFSHGFPVGLPVEPGVALWEASFVLAEWLSRQGHDAGGLAASRAFQEVPSFGWELGK